MNRKEARRLGLQSAMSRSTERGKFFGPNRQPAILVSYNGSRRQLTRTLRRVVGARINEEWRNTHAKT
jgi:hypothetical protein